MKRVERLPMPRFLPRTALTTLVLLGFTGAASADEIVLLNGQRRSNIQVTLARWDQVQYVINKAPTTVPGEQIESVTRDSNFLQGARDAIKAGNWSKALAELGGVTDKAKDWEQAEAKYLTGQVHLLSGNAREAEKAYKAYLDKYKADKDWFVPFATNEIAEALLQAKQPGTAGKLYNDLASYGERWATTAKLGQGMAMLAEKGESAALAARRLFDEVKGSQAPLPVRQKAMVWRAKAFLLQKQPDQVIKELNTEFFENAKAGELSYGPERAEATLLMGKAYQAQGGKENLEQAEIWFLRVVALFRKDLELQAQAQDALVDVYTQLGNKPRADEWKGRKGAGAGRESGAGGK
jgi:hypothetical protein